MFIDEKEFKLKLGQAECLGVDRARNTLIFIHQHKAKNETDPLKKKWHEEEVERLRDDNRWNLLEE